MLSWQPKDKHLAKKTPVGMKPFKLSMNEPMLDELIGINDTVAVAITADMPFRQAKEAIHFKALEATTELDQAMLKKKIATMQDDTHYDKFIEAACDKADEFNQHIEALGISFPPGLF